MGGVRVGVFIILVGLLGGADVACRAEPRPDAPLRDAALDVGKVTAVDFHGWPAMALRNGRLEIVVVPAIGRVMSLRFAGDDGASDPIWRHGQLGLQLAADENGWINYGGDKAWPAPQADWQRILGKGWPPPATFDATAHAATMKGSAIELVSPVDPAYGIRVRRTVTLAGASALIETAYEKVEGIPVRVAVWTITQLQAPDRMFALLPEATTFTGGYRSLMPARPKNLVVDGRLLGVARDTNDKTMIATDADALLWVASGRELVVENLGTFVADGPAASWRPTEARAPRPEGAHAQIYTSPDGAEPYVELELLGPLVELSPGQRAMMSVRYRLFRREEMDPVTEARRLFELEPKP
jgi:hypothetical protein